jgi:glycosyltransferase involved in cell wall biosynthesis
MLSICIPVYNYDIYPLLQSLLPAVTKLKDISFEILIADDGSTPAINELNRKQATGAGVKYIEMTENSGRSAIRNRLGREAAFDTLLFLDCDSVIADENFLLNYLPFLGKDLVVYGGTLYQHEIPGKQYLLHWQYGRKREINPEDIRNSFPSRYFKTNNFLISKSILQSHPFNEALRNYGHEDTLLGIELYQNGIEIIHIENPVKHAGLEDNRTFLSKTEAGVRNLRILLNSGIDLQLLRKHVRILEMFARIQKFGLIVPVKMAWMVLCPALRYMILNRISLRALDFYKLGYLCKIW